MTVDAPDETPAQQPRPLKQEQLPAEDEATEVAPGVIRIQLPIAMPGLGHVNCYVLEDGKGVTLVDPGLPGPESNADLLERLGRIGVPAERIHTVLVTHSHPDHFGGAGRLHAEHHCEVVAHESFSTLFGRGDSLVEDDLIELHDAHDPRTADTDPGDPDDLFDARFREDDGPSAEMLEQIFFGEGDLPDLPATTTPWGGEGMRPGADDLARMRAWDTLSKRGLLSLAPTVPVHDEERIELGRRTWTVLHTPGHTGDHICLFDPESGTLLSGDHVLPTITPHISGMSPGPDALSQFFEALRRVAEIDGVTNVLPAHGLPFADLPGRVEEIIEHHVQRLAVLRDIAAEIDEATVTEYSRRLFRERSWGPMAESETFAHLEHLRLDGEMVARRHEDGQVRYRPA